MLLGKRLPNSFLVPRSLVEILRWRARHQPDTRAYSYLSSDEEHETHIAYAELDRKVRAIGATLQQHVARGSRALLLYPSGLDFVAAFFGCSYANVIAVPAPPPRSVRSGRNMARFRAIANDSQPGVVLTNSSILSNVEVAFGSTDSLQRLPIIATDEINEGAAADWREGVVSEETLAYLQYSSGSTGTPKGVMLGHGNILQDLSMLHSCFGLSFDNEFVNWAPLYHDMGLVVGILAPLFGGYHVTLMDPVAFVQRPVRWLQAISRYRATTSGGPNFAYELCVRRITEEQKASLDLSSWNLAFNASEPVREETLQRFVNAFERCGFRREAFYPCYGLAEATVLVSGGLSGTSPIVRAVEFEGLSLNSVRVTPSNGLEGKSLVACGKAVPGTKLLIVDPVSLKQCSAGEIGEIWTSGPNIAQGYWRRPEESAVVFNAYLSDTGEGPFLRTGDLGFLLDENLFITGRLKDLIIISGQNHYPQDIELTVEQSHPAIRPNCSAAFSVEISNSERLIVVAEIEPRYQPAQAMRLTEVSTPGRTELEAQAVNRIIRQRIAEEHELQVHKVLFIKSGTIPKTSSGKLQRYACRANFLAGTLSVWNN